MANTRSMELSIVVPTYNRKETLKRCVLSLDNQICLKDNHEIIIVDDGSTCDVIAEIKNFLKGRKNISYLRQLHKGPAAARNLGIEKAKGEIIAFLDDDCVADKNWIKNIIEIHRKNPDICVVGGLTLVPNTKAPLLVSQFLSTCSIETFVKGRKAVIFFPTCNVSFKSRIFDKYKFDESFPFPGGEDLEFFWRLFKDGHNFIWDKEMKIFHFRDESALSFIKQAYIYGRGNVLVQYFHKDHPLLKELKTGKFSFWTASLINIIKIPRFSYLLGRRLIREHNIKDACKKISVYSYFILHKIFYITGNAAEFIKIKRENLSADRRIYPLPRLLILDITHSCNLSCKICDIWKTGKSEKDSEARYIKRTLFEAKGLGIPEIALSGGEPLLRNDIFEIFDYARKLKIKNLGVLTNGILIGERIKDLTSYLADNTISPVISLDSLKPDIHNHIRNSSDAWQKTMDSLKGLSLLKKDAPQIKFNVISIVLNQNLEELALLADYIKSLGADSLQFQALLPNNLYMTERKKSIFWVTEDRLPALDKAVEDLAGYKELNPSFIRNSAGNLLLMKKYYRGTLDSGDVQCRSADKTVMVSNEGHCATCFSAYGDIKVKDLGNILSGDKRLKAQERVKTCSWPCLLPCFCD